MERVLSNELSRFLLIIGIGVVSLSALLFRNVSKARENVTSQKPSIFYLLISLMLFALAGCAEWFLPKTAKQISYFVVLQVYFLLLGIVHVPLMYNYLKWSGHRKSLGVEVLYTIFLSMLGSIVFVAVFRSVDNDGFEFLMLGSIFLFLVPLLFYRTFLAAISIPTPIVKQWFFPLNKMIEPTDQSKIKDLLIISFEFKRSTKDAHFTKFRVKAPSDMDFGKLFYFFINNYDERHPNSKIQITDDSGDASGWIFYKKPLWYTLETRYIDFENTFFVNKIKQNDIIICKRIHH